MRVLGDIAMKEAWDERCGRRRKGEVEGGTEEGGEENMEVKEEVVSIFLNC